jgi:photosystem II stability/assembly factor-like uncharacterized protein
MNVQSLPVGSVVITAVIFLFVGRIEAQQPRAQEGVRPDEMADLVAVAMTPSILFPLPGETLDIAVVVRNQATHSQSNVLVAFFAGRLRVAEKPINLKSGETATVHFSWKATGDGKVPLTAQVDPDFKFIERDRSDNLVSADVVVSRRSSSEVDLALLGIESVQTLDESTLARVQVRNNGKAAAKVPLVIRREKQIIDVRSVEVAANTTITVEIPLPALQFPTQLSAEINPRYRSSEKLPSDNTLVKDLRPAVDLRVEGLSVLATQFERSRPRQVTISFRVVNAGTSAINKAFRTSVFPGTISDNAEQLGAYFVTTESLPSGGTVYISRTIVSPVSEFDVRVEADAGNAIAEVDEGNNIVTSHFKNPSPDVGRWVAIGPRRITNGGLGAVGRLSAIAIHPTSSSTIYVGGLNCGVWKTADNGSNWQPIADALPSLSIAALAIDPSTPSRVYVATADATVFRSEDNGTSWVQLQGSPNGEVRWGVLIVHPTDRNVLYLTSAQGVHRSRDFGATWQLVLPGARATDLIMDVRNPNKLYVAREGIGVFKTINGGDQWTQLTNGLPPSTPGTIFQVTLALCVNSPANLYAGYSTSSGFRLFRTMDEGATWAAQTTPADPSLFNDVIGVDPSDPQFAYITGVIIYRRPAGSLDFVPSNGPHVDHHAFASDLTTGAIYSLNDGGVYRSSNRGETWEFIGEGILNVEFYDHAIAVTEPNLIIGGTQDNGTVRFNGPSTVWTEFSGGDGGTVDIDPTNSQILYTMNQGQESIARFVNGNASCIACSLPLQPVCFNLHFQVHPATTSTLLASCISLWRSDNPQCPQCPNPGAGSSGTPGVWSVILPGSTTTPGNVMRSAIDRTVNLFYAGTSVGELWAGPSGTNWRKVFVSPSVRTVTDIEIDNDNASIVYVSLDGDTGDRVFRLRRLSSSPTPTTMIAQAITSNLPSGLIVKTLAVDRMTPFIIYAGTNRGVFRGRSITNGVTWSWTSYNNGMPAADIRDLEVHPVTGVMSAASLGRGAFDVNTDFPVGSLLAAEGKLTFLRVHDVGTGFGPPTDFIDVEVVIALDSQPGKFFGFQLRADGNRDAHRDMLNLLRDAFKRERRVRIDYFRTGVRNGRIIRILQLP